MISVPAKIVSRLLPLLALLLGLASVLPTPAIAQDAFPYHEQEHLVAAQRSRERELLRAWSRAEAGRREEATAILRRGRDPRAPERQPVGFRALGEATRALEGIDVDLSIYRWRNLADAVDLRVVPGLFEARTEGRGEAMTVVVSTLYEVPWLEGMIEIVLFWISEDGEEQRARGERIDVAAFADGFEMYIRPPVSGPARWRLVAELRVEPGVARTHAVPVDCVADLRARAAGLPEIETPLARALVERLRALHAFGARSFDALPLTSWFDLAEGRSEGSPVRPLPVVEVLGRDGAAWEIAPADGAELREAVLILTTREEHPTDLLHDAVREAWASSPEAARRWVVAAAVPASAPGGGPARLLPLVKYLRARPGIERLTLIVREENALFIPGILRAGEQREGGDAEGHGVDALVMCETSAARVPPRVPLSIPILQLADEAAEFSIEEGPGASGTFWRRVSLTEPRRICPLELPGRIDAWSSGK